MVRRAPVLLLDDVTSALDPVTADTVRRSLANTIRGSTTLLVAQHLSTVRLADRVAVIDQGRVVAIGTPAEMEQHDAFRRALALDADFPRVTA